MELRINPAVIHMDESIIRDMTRVAEECRAVNLAQGFPEMPVPEEVSEAALEAIRKGVNHYTRTWGDTRLRRRLARHLEERWNLAHDPEEELVITCGASEAIMATLLALLPRGAGAVLPEPIYENYLPACRLAGAEPLILPIDPFTGAWDPALLDRLAAGGQSRSPAPWTMSKGRPAGHVDAPASVAFIVRSIAAAKPGVVRPCTSGSLR